MPRHDLFYDATENVVFQLQIPIGPWLFLNITAF